VVEVLQPPLRELVAPAVVESLIVEQHRDIVRAIERGDPTAAERAMREHLVYMRDLVAAMDGGRRG
jgi:DNA-binding FadR family transcriptional regulator